jgi:hypothetical protein
MKIRRVLCLKEQTTFHQPTSWELHARYALQRGGGEVILPAGTWLVELDPVETWPDQKNEYLYRTPSGEVIALESPLAEGCYKEVTDPQIFTAMNAFRNLDTILSEDFGMSLQRTCHGLPPFALIQCPLCSGTSFTTVDLASAWCDRCNAAFHARSTAGDPGFVVDVTWEHYNPFTAHYVLPRTVKLLSTLVLKDSGDPRDMSRDHCSGECRAGPILLTDGSTGLRPGLHRCQIGTLYDWRRIYGQVPAPEDLREDPNWEIDGQRWPAAAAIRVLPLKHSERRALKLAVNALPRELASAAREIQDILNLRSRSPSVLEAVLPDVRNLQEEERYLLHHWLTMVPDNPYDGYETALPVWYVVTPLLSDRYLTGWKVVRKDICPRCGDPVSPEDVALGEGGRSRWDIPHGYCRETWEKTGWRRHAWRLPDPEGGTGEDQTQARSPGGS